jgi:hypothetical protein
LPVWDQFQCHRSDAIKNKLSELKTKLAVIPGGLTSQLQPLEVSINKPFKGFMKEKWNSWMQSSDFKETPTERRQKPTILKMCKWVKNSWDAVTTERVFKSFKKCGISNSLNGTEDNLLFEDSDDSVPDSKELPSVSSSEDDNVCGFEDED